MMALITVICTANQVKGRKFARESWMLDAKTDHFVDAYFAFGPDRSDDAYRIDSLVHEEIQKYNHFSFPNSCN